MTAPARYPLRRDTSHAMIAGVCAGIARRFGNLVAVASDAELPIDGFVRRCARDPMPARVVHDGDLLRFVGTSRPVHDADAVDSPEPPEGVFSR